MMRLLRTLARSFRLYLVIIFPTRRIHFRLGGAPDVDIREEILKIDDRILTPDIYRAHHTSTAKRAAIIIYVPLAQEGKRDPLITNFMEGLAHLGYIVMVPFWPNRTKGTIATTDRDDFVASLNWLRAQPDVDGRRIAIVAVSYGAAPVLVALSDAAVAAKVQFVSLIGGLADMKNLAEFALTGHFAYEKFSGRLPPDPYLSRILYRAAAAYLTTPTDKQYFQALANDAPATTGVSLTGDGQKIADLFATRTPEQFAIAYAALPARMLAWLARLSPINTLNRVTKPTLILHSTNDELVPYTESLRLYAGLRPSGHANLTLVNVFEHTVPVAATPWNLIRIYLPNLGRIVRYIHRILAYQEEVL